MQYLTIEELNERIAALNSWLFAHQETHFMYKEVKKERDFFVNHEIEMRINGLEEDYIKCATSYYAQIQRDMI